MRGVAMTIIDVTVWDKDPLDLIVKNKDFINHLKANGIKGLEVRNILYNLHGLQLEIPINDKQRHEKRGKYHQIAYAIRYIKILLNNDAVSDEDRESLDKMMTRLVNERKVLFPYEINSKGNPVIKTIIHPEEHGKEKEKKVTAKSFKQALGIQALLLHEYIRRFNQYYLQKDIFDLIAELFEVIHGLKFSQNKIANFYKNNLKFL